MQGRKLKTVCELTSDLKCFKSLTLRSKVPAAEGRPGRKPKDKEIKPRTAPGDLKRGQVAETWAQVADPWQETPVDDDGLLRAQQEKLCGRHRMRVPVSIRRKPNNVAAVTMPDPGTSYNPSQAAWQSLVRRAVKDETCRVAAQQRVAQSVANAKTSEQLVESEFLREMAQGLTASGDEDEGEEMQGETRSSIPVTAVNRKTKAQRNREDRAKRALAQARRRKEVTKAAKVPLRLPQLLQQIRDAEAQQQRRQEVRQQQAAKRRSQVSRKVRYLLPEPLMPDPSAARGSLRAVKVQGNLQEERFRGLLARSLVDMKEKRRRKGGRSLLQRKAYVKRCQRSSSVE